MAGLPWFELDTDFSDGPKIAALKARLREPLADAYVARLYAYCYKHVRDRFEPDVAAEVLESAVKWRGRRGRLFDALMQVGVLERDAGKVVVHGVAERLAPHVASLVAAAARQKRRRAKVAKSIEQDADVTRDVQRDVQRDVTGDVTRESRGTSRPALSMSVSGQCEYRISSSDEATSTVPSPEAGAPAGGLEATHRTVTAPPSNGLDAEAQAMLALLPAKAVDVAAALDVPPAAVDLALEEFRRAGRVRLRGGLVPVWERTA
jgi:hypothetical protein